MRRRGSHPGTCRSSWNVDEHRALPPTRLGHRSRAGSRVGARARSRRAQRVGNPRLVADARLRRRSPSRSRSDPLSPWRSPCSSSRGPRRAPSGISGGISAAERIPWRWAAAGAGAALGILLWQVAGSVQGDGLFHLARARKMLELDELSLKAVGEFADASLHPGYAFPLWHGFLALVSRVSGAELELVVLHLPSILAVLASRSPTRPAGRSFEASGPPARSRERRPG